MNVPEALRYTETHEWVRQEADGTLLVGITDHAQEVQGDVVFVELPKVGHQLAAGSPCVVVESAKANSDVHAPVSGEVVAVNAVLVDNPGKLNEDPYGAWLFRMKPANASDLDRLLDAGGYRNNVD